MKVLTPTKEHLRGIKVRAFELADQGDTIDDATIQYYLSADRSYTLLDDDENVIAILGGNYAGDNSHTWMLASDLMYLHPVATLKLIMRSHKEGIQKDGIKTFYTYNLPGFKREIDYLQSIGYREESRTSDFDDGKERILFVKRVL